MEESEKRKLVKEFKSSGINQSKYCKLKGLAQSSFIGWRKKYDVREEGNFIEVSLEEVIELEFPNGVKVKVSGLASESVYKKLRQSFC